MRVAIYLRQSQDRTGEQLGIDRQREDCLKLIAARGWTLAAEFIDNDVSATSRKPRPQFNAMMRGVDAGEFNVIVTRHMDRLLRRLAELEMVLERCQKAKTTIVTAADGVDTGTDGGRLVARLLSSVAQGEVERKSARQRSAVAQAAKQGRWVGGRRAFGFDDDGVTVREDEAALIKQGYAEALAGESLAQIAKHWNEAGAITPQGNPWKRHAIRDVLTNPRYAGLRRHRPQEDRAAIRQNPELGIVGQANWPAIVDESTWRATARTLCDPKRYRPANGGKGLLTGVAVCAVCGETLHRGAGSRGRPMYRCRSGRHVSRKSEPIDEFVTGVVLTFLKSRKAKKVWTVKRPDAGRLMAEADVLRRELDAIDEDRMARRIDRARWRTMNERITAQLADIEAQMASAGRSSALGRLVSSTDVEATWEELSTAERRGVIAAVMVPAVELVGAGVRTFKPEQVSIRWKVDV